MNNIRKIRLNSDKDILWHTISSATKITAKYIRQTSSSDCFAKVNLSIKPYPDRHIAIFKDRITEINLDNTILYPQQQSDRDTVEILNIITSGITKGIEKACLDLTKKSYLIGGIEIIATSAVFHLVDSRSLCYEMAVYLALLQIFPELDIT